MQETLNARTEYTSDDSDGRSHHKINQYTIKEEIGRGSYGAVHLAVDQYGQEYVRCLLVAPAMRHVATFIPSMDANCCGNRQ